MRIFVTGATGYIGSVVVQELLTAGHQVIGLTRSSQGAAKLKEVGAMAHPGSLEDLDSLHSAALAADGVIHLAFNHDFSDFQGSLATDLRVIETIGAALIGSGKPFVTTAHAFGTASDNAVLGFAKQGVRAMIVELSPSVHGEGDKGFVPRLIQIARDKGFSAYIGDGYNRWPAVHKLDAAHLFRLALENGPAGERWQGVGDEGIPFCDIASVIGHHLNLPVKSITPQEADTHFGFLGAIAAQDMPRSSTHTQELLNWHPTHPTLIADLEAGFYFNK